MTLTDSSATEGTTSTSAEVSPNELTECTGSKFADSIVPPESFSTVKVSSSATCAVEKSVPAISAGVDSGAFAGGVGSVSPVFELPAPKSKSFKPKSFPN